LVLKNRSGLRSVGITAVLLAWAAWVGAQAVAADLPVMNWTVTELPPGSMPVDGKLTDGIYDVALEMVWKEWPQVQHQITVANAGRAVQRLAEGQPTCFSGAVRTPERDKIAYYTATHLIPALKVITTQAKAGTLPKNPQGEVLPASLFGQGDLRGLVLAHRSYTPVIDALLEGKQPHPGVRTVVSSDGGVNVLQMLLLDRADYTLSYDHSLKYQLSRAPELTHGKGGTKLVALPLAGTEPVLTGIYCPKTPWGHDAIVRIDAILTRVSQQPRYQEAADRWLTAETLKAHRALELAFYKRRAKPWEPGGFQ
jgi:uncharacterized protein (TIGR02285 family)